MTLFLLNNKRKKFLDCKRRLSFSSKNIINKSSKFLNQNKQYLTIRKKNKKINSIVKITQNKTQVLLYKEIYIIKLVKTKIITSI